MKAESIEQIREHLARGGRVVCWFKRRYAYPRETYEVQGLHGLVADLGDNVQVQFESDDVEFWELLPIEENPKPSREWLERMAAEEDKCVSVGAGCFDDVCVTCGIGYYLPSGRCDHCDNQKVEQRQAEHDFPINNMYTEIASRLADISRRITAATPPGWIKQEIDRVVTDLTTWASKK